MAGSEGQGIQEMDREQERAPERMRERERVDNMYYVLDPKHVLVTLILFS